MSNVHFTTVTNYIQYIRQDQPEVCSEQSQHIPLSQQTAANEGQSGYDRQKKSHALTVQIWTQPNPTYRWTRPTANSGFTELQPGRVFILVRCGGSWMIALLQIS